MLTLEQMKKLLNDPSIPDSQVLEIRDQLYSLAEIIFEKWQREKASCRDGRNASPTDHFGQYGKE